MKLAIFLDHISDLSDILLVENTVYLLSLWNHDENFYEKWYDRREQIFFFFFFSLSTMHIS